MKQRVRIQQTSCGWYFIYSPGTYRCTYDYPTIADAWNGLRRYWHTPNWRGW